MPAVSIQVHSASIVGATAFPAAKLNGMIAGLAGQSVPLTKLEAARLALVRLYRSHGYILSTVTLDVSATGDVRFVVTEGYVTNVKLSKDIGPAGTMVLGFSITSPRSARCARQPLSAGCCWRSRCRACPCMRCCRPTKATLGR
ncbi:hypothetical protein GT370_14250 [Acidocella sp. MX-AZ03]|uniref:POTRA domain-containing protein n=1 Tax=Acidocella sp. MX-AZ03 TaxID=2697363 RepID=UPI0022DE5DD4|nr:POTRA domain-containing protein [Acidocella sp. MX-AZ03]WBO58357.1 hypothetical protein GT370_14250 [Acidocella sp. MX-AZ03]